MSERNYEIARFIRVARDPEDMSEAEKVDCIYELAEYASRRLSECITFRNIIKDLHTPK